MPKNSNTFGLILCIMT